MHELFGEGNRELLCEYVKNVHVQSNVMGCNAVQSVDVLIRVFKNKAGSIYK